MKTIRRLTQPCAPFEGVFHPDELPGPWKALEEWKIECFPWDGGEGYRPPTYARVGVHNGDLWVLMYALEEKIQARETRCDGPVCVDSCLEFFLQPAQGDPRYLNCEANPLGTLYLEIGTGRGDRKTLHQTPPGVNPVASRHEGAWWAVCYRLPGELLQELFGQPLGTFLRANLYCCDESIHPHFGTLFPVAAPQPDFHRPECFGTIAIEQEV